MHNFLIFLGASSFIYSSFLVGQYIIKILKANFSKIHKVVFAILLGYGFWGSIGFLLGILGFFKAEILRLFFILVFVFSLGAIIFHLKNIYLVKKFLQNFFKECVFFKIFVILWIFLTFLIVFMPITGYDTLTYHLPIIEDIIDKGKLTFSDEIYVKRGDMLQHVYTFLPVFTEIIYAVPLIIFNNITDPYIFQIIQFTGLLLFLLLIYDFSKKIVKNSFLPIILILATMSMMDFQREILHGGYVDVLMFVFGIASMFILIEGIGDDKLEKGNMIVSALLLGFAVSTKIFALFFVGFNGLLLFYYFRIGKFIKVALKYFSISAVISGFWYIKNLIVYNNIFYPLFTYPEYTQGAQWFMSDRNIVNMFLFPFLRFGKWFYDATESSSTLVSFSYFFLIYVLIFFFLFMYRRFNFKEIAIFIASHLYLWFLFFNSHHIRFLMASTMLIPLILILLLDKMYSYFNEHESAKFNKYFIKISLICAAVIFLVTFVGSIHFFQYKYRYLVGLDTKEEYIMNIGGL